MLTLHFFTFKMLKNYLRNIIFIYNKGINQLKENVMLITVAEAKRDFSHGVIAEFVFSAEGPYWTLLVVFNHQRGSEYIRAVQGDGPRLFKTLDAAVSLVRQIAGSVDMPRLVVGVIHGQLQK